MRQLFENAEIYTDSGVVHSGFLAVDGDTIREISATRPEGEFEVVRNLSGNILMPGLVNAHTHTPMTVLRGLGTDLPLKEWLFGTIFPVEAKMIGEDVNAGVALALLEMVSGGTTSFTDMYYYVENTPEIIISSGLKANICYPVQEFVPGGKYETNASCRKLERMFDQWDGKGDGRIRVEGSIHAEYTCQDDVTRGVAAWAKGKKTGMHVHLSETESEHRECGQRHGGLTPTEWMLQMGLLDVPCNAAHCVCVSETDMDILLEKGVTSVHNPTSNMKLGSGFAPVPEMISKGIRVALGTDGTASNNNLNMFEEMHLASLIHNGLHRNASLVHTDTVLKMATRNGAEAQGRFDTGILAAGMKADLVVIDVDKPHMIPNISLEGLAVYSAQASDVLLTMVDGQALYENGEYLTLDRDRIIAEAKASVRRLLG